MNPLLMKVIVISVGIHVIAGFIATVITVANIVIQDEAQFEEPPAVVEEEPPPPVKVKIQPPPTKQQQPQRLSMRPVANIAVADVDVNLPDMDQSFTVSSGLGGVGGGSLLGGTRGSIGMGLSDVSVFGLKTRAERILFVIDVNRQMLTDNKGGLNSFRVIKDEITDMVGNLSAGTLFNVMLMDRRKAMLFKPQLVSAGSDVNQELIKWLAPINSNADKVGLESVRNASNISTTVLKEHPVHKSILFSGQRDNETATQTQLALEQGVDAVFIITGYHRGFAQIRRLYTEQEDIAWKRRVSDQKYIDQLAAHRAEYPEMDKRVKAALAKINKERVAKGQPKRVLDSRHGLSSRARELKLQWKNPHPGHRPAAHLNDRDVEKYFKELIEEIYTNKNAKAPSLNVILLLAKDEVVREEHEQALKKYVRFFSGKSRIIRGLAGIKSASSAKATTN